MENTTKNNKWALRNFEAWRDARNKQLSEDLCLDADKLLYDIKVAGSIGVCLRFENLIERNIHREACICY